jgi:hypothetical protein
MTQQRGFAHLPGAGDQDCRELTGGLLNDMFESAVDVHATILRYYRTIVNL